MVNQNNIQNDFRIELYNKYITGFKNFISNKSNSEFISEYKVFKKRYLPFFRNFSKNLNILELGCGSGDMLQFLKREGFQNLYGIDISEQQVEIAKGKGLNVEIKNVFELFINNTEKYDSIIALDFIEHFNKNELLEIFKGLKSIMNNNGILIIHTPNGQGLFPGRNIYGDLTHLTIFNPNSMTQILKVSGFNNINFYETGPVLKNVKGAIRFILWKFVKFFFKGIKMIETGRTDNILTENFICTARI